jgi:hypothetical protein
LVVVPGHSGGNTAAQLALQLQQFGYKTTSAYPGTILETLGAVGGFASIFLVVCSMLRGFMVVTYKVYFKMKAPETRAGGCFLALYLLFVAVLRCIGLVPDQAM